MKRQDGRIIPVRLSLFGEMMRSKPWVPGTLKNAGGFEGLGVAFLEETFAATTAPPEHRLHQEAARMVLKMFLPEEQTNIRGRMRSYRELAAASNYRDREEDFANLLQMLDTELRLITPTDPEGTQGVSAANGSAHRGEKYYQLTHDYLVPTIRQWLTLKQNQTIRGRAALRLSQRAAFWASGPDRRHVLSLWEFLDALVLTQRSLWTAAERGLMAASVRYHSIRGFVLAAVLVVLALLGVESYGRLRGTSLHDRLMDASTSEVPAIIPGLAPYRRWVDPLLAAELSGPGARPESRRVLHARLALLPVDPGQVPYLRDRLLEAEPPEFLVIRAALRPHGPRLRDGLWALVESPEAEKDHRFRAACALADFDPGNRRHAAVAPVVVALLTTQSGAGPGPLDRGPAPGAERPRRLLDPGLPRSPAPGGAVQAQRVSWPTICSTILTRCCGWRVTAEPRQLAVLAPRLKPARARVVPVLEQELGRVPAAGASPEEARCRAPAEGERGCHTPRSRPGRSRLAATPVRTRPKPPRLFDSRVWTVAGEPPCADPSTRSHDRRLGPPGADSALGEYCNDSLSSGEWVAAARELLVLARDDPDPGVHSALDWLLRRWEKGEELDRIETEMASDGPRGGRALVCESASPHDGRRPGTGRPHRQGSGVLLPGSDSPIVRRRDEGGHQRTVRSLPRPGRAR